MSAFGPIPLTSIPGFRFGHYTDQDGGTGCTAIIAPDGRSRRRRQCARSRTGFGVRPTCFAPRTPSMRCMPSSSSGGSAFGLEAASGAPASSRSTASAWTSASPGSTIACSSCLFDLAFGRAGVRPSSVAGILAVRDALFREPGAALQEGNVGAGTVRHNRSSSTAPDLLYEIRSRGARFPPRPLMVGAISAVNAWCNVIVPATQKPVAGMRAHSRRHDDRRHGGRHARRRRAGRRCR